MRQLHNVLLYVNKLNWFGQEIYFEMNFFLTYRVGCPIMVNILYLLRQSNLLCGLRSTVSSLITLDWCFGPSPLQNRQ